MSEWTNEWVNKLVSERMNEWTSKRINKWTTESVHVFQYSQSFTSTTAAATAATLTHNAQLLRDIQLLEQHRLKHVCNRKRRKLVLNKLNFVHLCTHSLTHQFSNSLTFFSLSLSNTHAISPSFIQTHSFIHSLWQCLFPFMFNSFTHTRSTATTLITWRWAVLHQWCPHS